MAQNIRSPRRERLDSGRHMFSGDEISTALSDRSSAGSRGCARWFWLGLFRDKVWTPESLTLRCVIDSPAPGFLFCPYHV
jgi:hypothetical protein